MELTLFHGSDHVIERPVFGEGKPYNDYGLGFYCTENLDMAKEWAVGFDHGGFANKYCIDTSNLSTIDLNGGEFTTLHWLAVLLEHRWFDIRAPLANEARTYIIDRFSVDLSDADLVTGYRADDSYFAFAQDFISGMISYRQLNNAMCLGDLGRQFVLKSERAFERVRFVKAHLAPRNTWLPRREQRDRDARARYFDRERNARTHGDLFITAIIDEGMGPDDERLR